MNPIISRFITHFNLKSAPSPEELAFFSKAQKYAKFVSWIPWLRMIAVCNTISMYASDKDSDIDLFIVTDPNRMWLVRILATGIFQILWVRRHGNKIAWRLCLSFFATTKGLDFSDFRIEHDVYLAYWIYFLKPIVDKGSTYEMLRKANESWTSEFFSIEEHCPDERKWQYNNSPWQGGYGGFMKWLSLQKTSTIQQTTSSQKPLLPPLVRGANSLLSLIDSLLKTIFLPKTLAHKEKLKNSSGIIINDHMLKFHNNDRRKEVRDALCVK